MALSSDRIGKALDQLAAGLPYVSLRSTTPLAATGKTAYHRKPTTSKTFQSPEALHGALGLVFEAAQQLGSRLCE